MKKCDVICGHVKAKSVSKKNSCKSQLLSLQSKDFPLHKFAFFHDLNLKKHAIMFFSVIIIAFLEIMNIIQFT